MTPDQREARYCIPCGVRGDHTTLDPFCPKKRTIIQKRIKEAREKRKENQQAQDRDNNLIQNAFDLSSSIAWPTLDTNIQREKISAILMLTLLDEAVSEGSFQSNLSKACQDNDLPQIIYSPNPNTATALFDSMTKFSDLSCTRRQSHDHLRQKTKKRKTQKTRKCSLTKYTRDQSKRQGGTYNLFDLADEHESDINNFMKQGKDIYKAIEMTMNKNEITQSSIINGHKGEIIKFCLL